MTVESWVAAELSSLRQRLQAGFINAVPADRWRETVDGGGVPALYVAWHTARHHDLCVNVILRGTSEVLDGWRDRVGISGDTWRGLAEAQDHELIEQLDPAVVGQYLLAVLDESIQWLETADLADLDAVPDSAAALASIGTPTDRFDWLYDLWQGKPRQFFLSWEAVGHGYNHLGELISLRNRLGLSPF